MWFFISNFMWDVIHNSLKVSRICSSSHESCLWMMLADWVTLPWPNHSLILLAIPLYFIFHSLNGAKGVWFKPINYIHSHTKSMFVLLSFRLKYSHFRYIWMLQCHVDIPWSTSLRLNHGCLISKRWVRCREIIVKFHKWVLDQVVSHTRCFIKIP